MPPSSPIRIEAPMPQGRGCRVAHRFGSRPPCPQGLAQRCLCAADSHQKKTKGAGPQGPGPPAGRPPRQLEGECPQTALGGGADARRPPGCPRVGPPGLLCTSEVREPRPGARTMSPRGEPRTVRGAPEGSGNLFVTTGAFEPPEGSAGSPGSPRGSGGSGRFRGSLGVPGGPRGSPGPPRLQWS